ncbi:hypothetical protein IE81DRAFT_347331 [Ceraceosorus guamensis]|uniref:Uncharacterized protein n=1 Tax=Ceraceosorus guamensis TaxID=1522189 RepID=A0A316VY80_9BASI|nr:hypothetical protein IE81DRAFT_347331 [Ceraceosorus guamensis]PWN42586.1 hypothetical protein IE81DRAFT_347331 [Ceraceosorus guamensis]
MGPLQYGPDLRIHCWLHSPQILCALYNLARDPLGFDPALNLWPCFQLNGNGQHYIRKDLLPLSNEHLKEHEKKCRRDKPWTLLLRGREGFIKYAGTVHRNFDGNGPAARNTEDHARSTVATTRLSRWATGEWSVYALVDGFQEWRRSSTEQDAERFLISILGPLSANSARGGLHLRFSPSTPFREAAENLLVAAGVTAGRPPLSPCDHAIESMMQEHCNFVNGTKGQPLERAIDMASQALSTTPFKLMIIMKDITAEDLRNNADDYGLHGVGCGQGPEGYQRNLTLCDYASNNDVHNGVFRVHDPPAYS